MASLECRTTSPQPFPASSVDILACSLLLKSTFLGLDWWRKSIRLFSSARRASTVSLVVAFLVVANRDFLALFDIADCLYCAGIRIL